MWPCIPGRYSPRLARHGHFNAVLKQQCRLSLKDALSVYPGAHAAPGQHFELLRRAQHSAAFP
jgi:hypothetical protein